MDPYTPKGKAQYVSWFIEKKLDVHTQQNYRTKHGRNHHHSCLSIRLWHKKFMETGTVFDAGRSGRPKAFEENIECVRQASNRSFMKFIHR